MADGPHPTRRSLPVVCLSNYYADLPAPSGRSYFDEMMDVLRNLGVDVVQKHSVTLPRASPLCVTKLLLLLTSPAPFAAN